MGREGEVALWSLALGHQEGWSWESDHMAGERAWSSLSNSVPYITTAATGRECLWLCQMLLGEVSYLPGPWPCLRPPACLHGLL